MQLHSRPQAKCLVTPLALSHSPGSCQALPWAGAPSQLLPRPLESGPDLKEVSLPLGAAGKVRSGRNGAMTLRNSQAPRPEMRKNGGGRGAGRDRWQEGRGWEDRCPPCCSRPAQTLTGPPPHTHTWTRGHTCIHTPCGTLPQSGVSQTRAWEIPPQL